MYRCVVAAMAAGMITPSGAAQAQFVIGPQHFAGEGPFPRGPAARVRGLVLLGHGPLIPVGPFAGLPFYGTSSGLVIMPAATVLFPAPLILSLDVQRSPPVAIPPGLPPPMPRAEAPQADKLADKLADHIVIRPRKALPPLPPPEPIPLARRDEAKLKLPPEPLPVVKRESPRTKPPAAITDPFAAREAANQEKPDPNPVKELARLVKLGKAAFAAGEYGAASEHFERAMSVDRKSALPLFLKAQAAFASGRYGDAATSIRAGLRFDPAWPANPFDLKELYGPNAATFAEHLAALRSAVAANPQEPMLTFLLGYELWFVGEKTEASRWFDQADKLQFASEEIKLFR